MSYTIKFLGGTEKEFDSLAGADLTGADFEGANIEEAITE